MELREGTTGKCAYRGAGVHGSVLKHVLSMCETLTSIASIKTTKIVQAGGHQSIWIQLLCLKRVFTSVFKHIDDLEDTQNSFTQTSQWGTIKVGQRAAGLLTPLSCPYLRPCPAPKRWASGIL